MNPEQLEKYSSAITLSDMEVFVYPELMYSLVLANIMSPILWRWREEETFVKLEGKSAYRKLMRMKQYIMDEYEFNLDLNTWGLTTRQRELERFKHVISPEEIAASNALFGYHGDKYYFDVDIRRHFGLDKYDGDIIPYWKTETAEAMTAFRFKDNYDRGAGECVSLSTLYAAAAFIVCGIPLDDLYMVLTPLHSQNYLDINEGVITNNRRLVTKSMWFNGTALSMKAQRALRNEQVTIVAHSTGYIHCLYDLATIDRGRYEQFTRKLQDYLTADLDMLMFANFLRCYREYQKHFQFCTELRGEPMFIDAEVLFHYEHGTPYRIADQSYEKLLDEIDSDDYASSRAPDRLCCEQLRAFLEYEKIDILNPDHTARLKEYLRAYVPDVDEFVKLLREFIRIEPRLPSPRKHYRHIGKIELSEDMTREDVIASLESIRETNPTADLAFYAYRDMARCDWEPFIKAGIERNPVTIEHAGGRDIDAVYDWLNQMSNLSIYDEQRLAQPDEVINFRTGDGIEKAFALADVIRNRRPDQDIQMTIDREDVILNADREYRFASAKGFQKELQIDPAYSSPSGLS